MLMRPRSSVDLTNALPKHEKQFHMNYFLLTKTLELM